MRERQRVGIPARVSDAESGAEFACFVLDATATGCRLFCEQAEILPAAVALKPDGMANPIEARVVWRKNRLAGLAIEWPHRDR